MKNQNSLWIIPVMTTLLFLLSCDGTEIPGGDDGTLAEITYTTDISDSSAVNIALQDNGTIANDDAVTVSKNTVTITAPGIYRLTGSLSDGYVLVNSDDDGLVLLVLDGVDITHGSGPAIAIIDADYAGILLAEGSKNRLEDNESYGLFTSDDDPDAAVFSYDDLVIYGNGSLTVTGHHGDGIKGKDRVILDADSLTVIAADDGIVGRDALIIKRGAITIDAGGDGLKTTNGDDSDWGYLYVVDGAFTVDAAGDALSAETAITIESGTFDLSSGGGQGSSLLVGASAKGLKAGTDITITNGIFTISSADDAMNANETVTINDGIFDLATDDDAIHGDTKIVINGGTIDISVCYEGIESYDIVLNDGTIHLTSYDDGINISDGSGGGGMPPGPGGGYSTSSAGTLIINGGYTFVNARGDGIDVNGAVQMTGGTLIINGPTSNDNGALDYDRTFILTGGTLIASGSSGMAQAPSSSSTQTCIKVTYASTQSAGTIFHLQTSAGETLIDYAAEKYYKSMVFSSPDLQRNVEYTLYKGGSCTGEATDGCYSGATYTPGTLSRTFTLSYVVTSLSVY